MAQEKHLDFAVATFKVPECCEDCPFFVRGRYDSITCKHPEGPFINHDYKRCISAECPLQFVRTQLEFVKPDESTEGFKITQGSRKYEDAIIVGAHVMKTNEEVLKQVLRNYDQLVKEKNGCENLELPYWCYGWCGENE